MTQYVKINISRDNVFQESFTEIMRIRPHDLRRRLYIQFKGEEGLDYGGVAREWFYMVSQVNRVYKVFFVRKLILFPAIVLGVLEKLRNYR